MANPVTGWFGMPLQDHDRKNFAIRGIVAIFSGKDAKRGFGSPVEHTQQGARRTGRAALPLLPIANRLRRHVDAPREIHLAGAHPPPDSARIARHVLQRLGLVFPLLRCNLRLGSRVHPRGDNPPFGKCRRVVGVSPDARCAHSSGRNDADGRTPHRVDDDIGPPVDHAEQPAAILAIFLPVS